MCGRDVNDCGVVGGPFLEIHNHRAGQRSPSRLPDYDSRQNSGDGIMANGATWSSSDCFTD